MAIVQRRTLVRAGHIQPYHTVCQTCANLYTEYGDGCPYCYASALALANLDGAPVQKAKSDSQPPRWDWWLGVQLGTRFYETPEDAANHRHPLGEFDRNQVVKWQRSIWVYGECPGNVSEIPSPDPRFQKVYVSESLHCGVRKRKREAEAKKAISRSLRE